MKKVVCLLMALVLLTTTGCAQIAQKVVSTLENIVEETQEDFQNEVINEITEEVLPIPNHEKTKAEDNALTPTIEYRGITYTPYMTITAEELYEWIPSLNKINLSEGTWRFGSMGDPFFIKVQPWEEARTSNARAPYLQQYTYGDPNADHCLWSFITKEFGASSNGIYIGDPAENILKTFPDAYAEGDSFSVYFYDGEIISFDEYNEMRPQPIDADYEMEFEWKYDLYILYFHITDEHVDTIGILTNYAYRFGL